MSTPTEPGFYWHRDVDEGCGEAYEWEIAQVLNDQSGPGIIIDGITKQAEEVTGEWGSRIPDPEECEEMVEAKKSLRAAMAESEAGRIAMTDNFAAFALVGFLASGRKGDPAHDCQTAAQIAYNYAEAMIEEREKR